MADNQPNTPTDNEAPQAPVIDSSRSLLQQASKIASLLPEEPAKEEPKGEQEDDKSEDTSKANPSEEPKKKGEEPETSQEDVEPEDTFEEEPEDDYVAPPLEDLPPQNQYVIDRLPEITVRGFTETDKDGNPKLKNFTVKLGYDQLPDDFQFVNNREMGQFNVNVASQEQRAKELVNQYQQEELTRNVQAQQEQDAIDVQNDIVALQRQGILPAFKYEATDPKFNSDPAVKEANEIYAIYEETNKKYVEDYMKTGRTTYKISYRDAADKYYAQQAREARKNGSRQEVKQPTQQKPADQERQKVARQVGAPQSDTPGKEFKGIRRGTTMQEIYNAYNRGVI